MNRINLTAPGNQGVTIDVRPSALVRERGAVAIRVRTAPDGPPLTLTLTDAQRRALVEALETPNGRHT